MSSSFAFLRKRTLHLSRTIKWFPTAKYLTGITDHRRDNRHPQAWTAGILWGGGMNVLLMEKQRSRDWETRLWTYPAKEWQHLPRQYLLLSFKYGRSDCDPEVPANSNILWYPGNTLLKVIIIITPAAAKTKGSLCTGACALTTVLWGKYYYCSHFHSEETEAGRD